MTKSRQKQGWRGLKPWILRRSLGEMHACVAFFPKVTPQSIWNGTARIQAEICCYHLEVSEDRIWVPRVSENKGRYSKNEGSASDPHVCLQAPLKFSADCKATQPHGDSEQQLKVKAGALPCHTGVKRLGTLWNFLWKHLGSKGSDQGIHPRPKEKVL